VSDIDPALMRRWQASPRAAEQVAARIAGELSGKQRWHPVDGSPVIAARMDVSADTVRRAKVLLADSGVIMKSASRFYVT
jgi:DNA-binding GntR family transcriptional regulator